MLLDSLFFRNLRMIFIAVLAITTVAHKAEAQQYELISSDLEIYCVQFPNGDYLPGVYERRTKNVALSEFSIEEARIRKFILKNQRRLKTLRRIRKQFAQTSVYNSKGLISFKKIYKAVNGQRYRQDSDRIVANTKRLITKIKQQNNNLLTALDRLESCRNREPFSTVAGGKMSVKEFEFRHPDFNEIRYMRGIVVESTLPRGKSSAVACVSVSSPQGTSAGKFPAESALRFTNNPCEYFSGRITRNPIFCPGILGGRRNGTLWLDWGVSTRSIYLESASSELRNLESKLERMGPVIIRPYKKKQGCR